MNILLNFIISIGIFIYGIQLFSSSLENLYQKKIKNILEKYTQTPLKGILFGTILTAIIQSSSLTTITTVGLVNSGILSFHASLGIMMGANLGTCVTSWFISLLKIGSKSTVFLFLNPNTYTPILLILGLFFYFNGKKPQSNLLIGFSFFMLGLQMMQISLLPIQELPWFKNLLSSLHNPFIGVLTGMIATSILQSSSATVAILQTISETNPITYFIATPIIMGENIGTCLTTLLASINTSLNAKRMAFSHLLYNILGTIFFLFIFYLIHIFKLTFIYQEVTSFEIALIHTVFNLLSIFIFYPFLQAFEKLIHKLVK